MSVARQAAQGSRFGQHGQVVAVERGAAGQVLHVSEGVFGASSHDAVGGIFPHPFDHA